MKKLEISIPVTGGYIYGNLTLVNSSRGLVVFAHGSGSSRYSPRNQHVADIFNSASLSTFLFDLLTEQEDAVDQVTRQFRFDIPLLAERLVVVTEWLKTYPDTKHAAIGYFGASTGAAAALIAAASLPNDISAVVSRGGRPDLAAEYLPKVQAPTELIVGALDTDVIALNQCAYEHMQCIKALHLIPGATHLFEEPGTLDQAAEIASRWFVTYLKQT